MQLFQIFLPSVKQMDDGVLKEAVLLPAFALIPPAVHSNKLHLHSCVSEKKRENETQLKQTKLLHIGSGDFLSEIRPSVRSNTGLFVEIYTSSLLCGIAQ